MSAGLPGLGLSGLFVLISALFAPITRIGRPRPSSVRPTRVGPIFLLSLVIAIAVVGVWDGVLALAELFRDHASHHSGHSAAASTAFASVPVLFISLSIMLVIIVGAELALHLSGPQVTRTPPPIPFPQHVQRADALADER